MSSYTLLDNAIIVVLWKPIVSWHCTIVLWSMVLVFFSCLWRPWRSITDAESISTHEWGRGKYFVMTRPFYQNSKTRVFLVAGQIIPVYSGNLNFITVITNAWNLYLFESGHIFAFCFCKNHTNIAFLFTLSSPNSNTNQNFPLITCFCCKHHTPCPNLPF
jgi:hypothetical protein